MMKNNLERTCLDVPISTNMAEIVEALLSGIGALEMSALMISECYNGDNCFLAAARIMGVKTLYKNK